MVRCETDDHQVPSGAKQCCGLLERGLEFHVVECRDKGDHVEPCGTGFEGGKAGALQRNALSVVQSGV